MKPVAAAHVVLSSLALAAYGCGAAPLSRHARAYTPSGEASVLNDGQRAHLDESLGSTPTRDRVEHRLALIATEPATLSTAEARALLESTLDWVQLVRSGWQPAWIEEPPEPPPSQRVADDVIAELSTHRPTWPSAHENVLRAVRATQALIEGAARGPQATRAWRAAMIELHGSSDECGEDGEEGAVAAAVRAHRDRFGGEITSTADEIVLMNEVVRCHVATLDGGARVSPEAPRAIFAQSCWARGGPPDGQCQPGGQGRGGQRPDVIPEPMPGVWLLEHSWYASIDALHDEEVVYVTIGAMEQAFLVVVARRDGVWRVIMHELAWTT